MNTNTEESLEPMILIGVQLGDDRSVQESLDELAELARTAGACTVGTLIQARESIHPGTYIGKGKIEEARALLLAQDAVGVICDDELTPAQLGNLTRELGCKVIDRTLLILDIFAKHAVTSEGKLQVELAQLRYRASRLVGMHDSLSRQGGGIGTRGPGEKKLETDRRLIRARIGALRAQIADMKRHRELLRSHRDTLTMKTAAIVGYTNAGKSTLLNALTGAGVLSEDKLFATLDPVSRAWTLSDGQEILLTDTVGFIRKLPHHLVEAFKSTLEEAKYADIILHVVDASSPQAELQMQTVYETLRELGVEGKTMVTLLNKQDLPTEPLADRRADYCLHISARTGEGLEELDALLRDIVSDGQILIERLFPYTQAGKIALIRDHGRLLSEEYTAEGIAVKALIPREIYGQTL